MELFRERGYVDTTVEEIAARAGLTERTFFRYFADKREVLFSGSKALEQNIVERIASAPAAARPLAAVAAALEAAGADLEASRDMHYIRARHALLLEHPDLQERELLKLAALTTAVKTALHARGVEEPDASLAAEAGIAAFKVGFERWLQPKPTPELHGFAAHIRAAIEALRAIAGEA